MRFGCLAALVFALAACAKSPSSIPPAAVSSEEYASLSCRQLGLEMAQATERLKEAEQKQNEAQVADALTVFLVLVPVSSLSGDSESDVARYKGEKLALERAIRKRC